MYPADMQNYWRCNQSATVLEWNPRNHLGSRGMTPDCWYKDMRRNRIRLEIASQKQSSDTHKTPYDQVKRCRERNMNIKASERVNGSACLHRFSPLFADNSGSCKGDTDTRYKRAIDSTLRALYWRAVFSEVKMEQRLNERTGTGYPREDPPTRGHLPARFGRYPQENIRELPQRESKSVERLCEIGVSSENNGALHKFSVISSMEEFSTSFRDHQPKGDDDSSRPCLRVFLLVVSNLVALPSAFPRVLQLFRSPTVLRSSYGVAQSTHTESITSSSDSGLLENSPLLYHLIRTVMGPRWCRSLASHLCDPDSIPGDVAPGFLHVGIVPDDAAGRRGFSLGDIPSPSPASSFRRCSILASLHPHQLSIPRSVHSLTHSSELETFALVPRTNATLHWRPSVAYHLVNNAEFNKVPRITRLVERGKGDAKNILEKITPEIQSAEGQGRVSSYRPACLAHACGSIWKSPRTSSVATLLCKLFSLAR
ncbi:hypothetical protein PR048_032534 [Dryococelus australis]|uniref:Uncharacterized protein n=1 Tax=Dryococelus australis TaxID=614101 RepID=A0ABQ9G398_9NEOP|nr:hypothetical protein PR048_032534 [Dryococelus australis]